MQQPESTIDSKPSTSDPKGSDVVQSHAGSNTTEPSISSGDEGVRLDASTESSDRVVLNLAQRRAAGADSGADAGAHQIPVDDLGQPMDWESLEMLAADNVSLFTSIASVELRGPSYDPDEGLANDPAWEHWSQHKSEFLEQYDRLGPLFKQLTCGPGPLFVMEDRGQFEPLPMLRMADVARQLSSAIEAAQQSLDRMAVCTAHLKEGPLRDYMTARSERMAAILQCFEHEEFLPVVQMKGLKIIYQSNAEPGGQAGSDDDQQPAKEEAFSDDEHDAEYSVEGFHEGHFRN